MKKTLSEVKTYWTLNPTRGDWKSYKEEMADVYVKEYWMPEVIDSLHVKGKKVLDVGSGQGTNLYYALTKGADAIGIDISPSAVRIAKRHLKQAHKSSARARQGNAERLPFKDETFDIVFSLGVLHHTANIKKAADEIYRVMKPGGTVCLMLYKRHTFQHYTIATIRGVNSLLAAVSRGRLSLFGIIHPDKKKKYGTFFHELLNCPILKTYSRKQVKKIFSGYTSYRFRTYLTGLTRVPDFIPVSQKTRASLFRLERKLENRLGFYLIAYMKK